MKVLSDLLAVILFFLTYTITKNMITATAVAVVFGILQAGFTYWKYKKLDTMQWVGLILIVVFGGATILLNDRMFFMLKTTILTWLSALVMLSSQLMGKNGLKLMLGQELQLPETVWNRLGWAWVVFCASSSITKALSSVRPRIKARGAISMIPASIKALSFSVGIISRKASYNGCI